MAIWQGLGTGNWSNVFNWAFFTPPNISTIASISSGNVEVTTLGNAASLVDLFGSRTVDVGAGGGLTVGGVFGIASGSTLVVHDAGSVSAGLYNVSGRLVVGGATPGVPDTSGTVLGLVNLSSSGKLIFNTNDQSTFSSGIIGSGSVEQIGSGANSFVTLSGANSYTGATIVNSSTLFALGGNAIGNTSGVIVNAPGRFGVLASEAVGSLEGGGAVDLYNSSTLTTGGNNANTAFSGVIGNPNAAGALTKTGTGTFTLTGANTYSGATNVNAGVLKIENASALGSTTGGTSVAANAALEVQGGLTVAEALTLNGTGVSNGGALRNISGENIWNGSITLGSQTRINSDAESLYLNGGVTGVNQNLILGGDGNVVVFASITTGTGSLTKDGAGRVDLAGTNTYTGVTTVNAGILVLGNGAAIADTGGVVVNAPGVLTVFDSETIGSLAGDGIVDLLDFDTLTTGGDNTSTTFSGVIRDDLFEPSNLTKTGTGTFTLSGANTYKGVTSVSEGVLRIENDAALGTTAGGTSVAADAALEVQGVLTVAEALTLNGTGVSDGGALRNVSGNNVVNGAITLAGATRINADADQLELNGGVTGVDQNLILGGAATTLVGSAIATGTGSLTKDGAGIVSLDGANTYTGDTTVNDGFLQLKSGAAIADTGAVVVNSPGALQVFASEAIGSLAGDGLVAVQNASTLTTGGANTSTTFSGVIVDADGAGSLTKTGTGTFTLSGANTYNGVTTVSAGVLRIENADALGTTDGGTSVAADAALEVQGGLTVAEALTLNGTGVDNGGALRNISGDNNWNGAITLGSQTRINADANQFILNGGVTGDDQNLILGADGFLLINSAITTGTGSLTKDGAGLVTLRGANTYTGATTVDAGVLRIEDGAAIADTGAVVVNAPGQLQVFASETIGSLAGDGGVTIFFFETLTTGGANTSTTFSGVISDDGGEGRLTKTGTGTFTLSGANTYQGLTNVSGGVLRIANDAALGSTSFRTNVAANAALEVQGGITVGEALTLNGTGVSNSGALRNVSGNNSLNGAITLGSQTRINSDGGQLSIFGGVTGVDQNLILGGAGNLAVYSAITTGTGSLTKDGAGIVGLFGANTYTGATTVNAGSLQLTNGAAIADAGAVVVNAPGLLLLTSSETIGSLAGDGAVGLFGVTLTTGAANTSTTFSGVLADQIGPGSLTKTGTGAFTMSGANTYQGVTTVSGGTLQLSGAGAIASSSNVVIANNPGTAFDISAISGASASIRDFNFAGPGSVGLIILGGRTLVVTHANGDFGTGTIMGSGAADGLSVTMDAAATSVSLAGLTFSPWTTGVDTITITGNALANTITGSARADVINGGNGADSLNGGLGADALNGGEGSDAADYSASSAGLIVDLLTPSSNTGEAAGDTYTLIENIRGSGFNDTLRGDNANNIINGGAGTDGMSGRGGNDTYIVDNGGDRVYESTTPTSGIDSGGLDTVFSSVTITLDGYSGIRFVENLTLAAGAGSINGFGNALANVLTGNSGNNTLDGGLGNDTMLGGGGNDIYVVESPSDQVFETTTTASVIDAGGIDIIQSSVTLNLDATAGVRFVERLTLTGTGNINATGNALANVLLGNSGNNTLNGGLGIDIMGGGAGDDIYVVDNIGDRVFETTAINTLIDAGGNDTMLSSVSTSIDAYAAVRFIENMTLTGADNLVAVGNAKDNVLLGNTGNNTLNGGLGADTMGGGLGNDIYVVDNVGDQVFETTTISSGIDTGGVDTIQSSVTQNLDANAGIRFVERLTLTGTGNVNGTGNALANVMIGNSGNNILDGGLGADIMGGGAGNDTYIVDSASDFVFETTTISTLIDAGGVDTIVSSLAMNLDATVGLRFVENLTLTGATNINATGNALANVLTGNALNNTLNGGLGADTMIGAAGNDTYIVDNVGDLVFETTTTSSVINAGGIDTIQSSVTMNLDAYAGVRFVESVQMTGTANIDATGNALANVLIGNSGNNTLNGGLGNDTMLGGLGNDTFIFNTALGANNIDTINGFALTEDIIRLDDAIFAGLAPGATLALSAFAANLTGEATGIFERIIYETDTGALFYDSDGVGGDARIQFATLTPGLALTNTDFFVF